MSATPSDGKRYISSSCSGRPSRFFLKLKNRRLWAICVGSGTFLRVKATLLTRLLLPAAAIKNILPSFNNNDNNFRKSILLAPMDHQHQRPANLVVSDGATSPPLHTDGDGFVNKITTTATNTGPTKESIRVDKLATKLARIFAH